MTFRFDKDKKITEKIMESLKSQLSEINAGSSRPSNFDFGEISKVGVLGSGLNGHGIAYVSAFAGMDVIMTDSSQDIANRGLDRINGIIEQGLKRKALDLEKKENILNLSLIHI